MGAGKRNKLKLIRRMSVSALQTESGEPLSVLFQNKAGEADVKSLVESNPTEEKMRMTKKEKSSKTSIKVK